MRVKEVLKEQCEVGMMHMAPHRESHSAGVRMDVVVHWEIGQRV